MVAGEESGHIEADYPNGENRRRPQKTGHPLKQLANFRHFISFDQPRAGVLRAQFERGQM